MIDRLARILAAAFPDCDAEHLAEAVLLAARRVEPAVGSADLLTPGSDGPAAPNSTGPKQTIESPTPRLRLPISACPQKTETRTADKKCG